MLEEKHPSFEARENILSTTQNRFVEENVWSVTNVTFSRFDGQRRDIKLGGTLTFFKNPKTSFLGKVTFQTLSFNSGRAIVFEEKKKRNRGGKLGVARKSVHHNRFFSHVNGRCYTQFDRFTVWHDRGTEEFKYLWNRNVLTIANKFSVSKERRERLRRGIRPILVPRATETRTETTSLSLVRESWKWRVIRKYIFPATWVIRGGFRFPNGVRATSARNFQPRGDLSMQNGNLFRDILQ